jgi:hypothetical protein
MIVRVGNVRYRLDFSYGVPKTNAARWDWDNHQNFVLGKKALTSVGNAAIHTFVQIKMSEDDPGNPKGTPWTVIARGFSRRNRKDRFYKNIGRIVALNHAIRSMKDQEVRQQIWGHYVQSRVSDMEHGVQQLLGLKL